MGLLDGKIVLVTGGTSGIGQASSILFAREGAKVVLTGRRAPEGAAVVDEIASKGGEATFIQADLAETASMERIVTQVVSAHGRLDCAFNNAGVSGGGPLDSLDEAAWDRVVDTNLKAAFFCLKAQAAQMKRQGGGGSILFNASVLGVIGFPGTSIYSASKGGVIAMARAAAVELGPDGIRVNSLAPSLTRTPMTLPRMQTNADGVESHPLAVGIPLGRMADSSEMASAALFLLSDLASYVSGHALVVDGGQSAN